MSIISLIIIVIADFFSKQVSIPWWLFLILTIIAAIEALIYTKGEIFDDIIDAITDIF